MKNKKILCLATLAVVACSAVMMTGCDSGDDDCSKEQHGLYGKDIEKPVIYLYPENDNTQVEVTVTLNSGGFSSLYPQNNNKLGESVAKWSVTADSDGTLVDLESGRELYSLYWEGTGIDTSAIETGYCVAGDDTEEFLYSSLKKQGLTGKEAEEFIIYWLPQMQNNKYNVISFDTTQYNEETTLNIESNDQVDTMIRINMRFEPSETYVEIEPETYNTPTREGFTVVEWGGTELN